MSGKYNHEPFRVFPYQWMRRSPTFTRRFSTSSPSFFIFSCLKIRHPIRFIFLTFFHFFLILAFFISLFLIRRHHSIFDIHRDWPEAWGSCLNPPLQYWFRSFVDPNRVKPCSNLVLLASQRGKAAQKRGISIAEGRKSAFPLDGCAMAHGGKGGSFSETAMAAVQNASGVSKWRWSRRQEMDNMEASCQMEWVTYSTECSANLNRMADISDMLGISLLIVGLQEPWMGWGGRTRIVKEVIQSLPADRLVLMSDADDVILLPTSACTVPKILARFRAVERPVLVGGERFCYPDGYKWSDYPPPPRDTPYKYLNGGTFLGFAWALIDIIGQAYRGDCIDDQREFTRVFLENTSYVGVPDLEGKRTVVTHQKEDGDTRFLGRTLGDNQLPDAHPYMKLDWFNTLLLPLGGAELLEFDFSEYKVNGAVRSKLTDGRPCIFHQNGVKEEDPHNQVVWPHLLEAIGIDKLREERGYMTRKKGT